MSSAVAEKSAARERLLTTLLLMALLHAIVLLGVTFGVGSDRNVTPALDVLLVTDDQPEAQDNPTARYLAQRSQRGAGTARRGATSTPEVVGARDLQDPGADTPSAEAVLATPAAQPEVVYAGYAERVLNVSAELRQPADARPPTPGRGQGDELRLMGDAATGQWISPDTRASDLAPYLDRWRRRVERLGTLNYPAVARARNVQPPVIEVALRADGTLLESTIQRSSGDAALDQAALQILRLASPFAAFPDVLSRNYRVLRFAYQWEFTVTPTTEATVAP